VREAHSERTEPSTAGAFEAFAVVAVVLGARRGVSERRRHVPV